MSGSVPTSDFIVAQVAGELGISYDDVMRGVRLAGGVNPRHISMWLARAYSVAGFSYPKLARDFGFGCFQSVCDACNGVAVRMDDDPAYRHVLTGLKDRIKAEWERSQHAPAAISPFKPRLPPEPERLPRPRRYRFPAPAGLAPRRRACLKCGAEFQSMHAGNRICPSCNRENKAVAYGMEMAG